MFLVDILSIAFALELYKKNVFWILFNFMIFIRIIGKVCYFECNFINILWHRKMGYVLLLNAQISMHEKRVRSDKNNFAVGGEYCYQPLVQVLCRPSP